MHELKENGLDVSVHATTIEEAADEIMAAVTKKEKTE